MAKSKILIEERPEDIQRRTHYPENLTKDGREIPDPTPMQPPLGYIKQPSMMENMRNMIRSETLRKEALASGKESFEDSEDFGEDEDNDPSSPYEANFDPLGDADRRALRGELPGDDDPQLQELTRRQRAPAPSNPTDPVEGGAAGSPDTPDDPPAGKNPVRSYFRRPPTKE